VREGAVPFQELAAVLDWQFHFDPSTYSSMIREDIPLFDVMEELLAQFSGAGGGGGGDGAVRRILELGTGTGETARRLLDQHPDATLVGIDSSPQMLAAARQVLPAERVSLQVARLEQPLPEGPFDLVASALCVHHLGGAMKAELFSRVARALRPGGRFVLGDVVVPADPADAVTSLTEGYDHPSPVADQLGWLAGAGFDAEVVWSSRDLAIIVADLRSG
jgi:SAM-dependent methyltransferase